jgi:tRNA/rRNA methyltransferase
MKTMGFRELLLADCPAYDERIVATLAVHAYDIYENARRFQSLEAALSGFPLSAGFTRRGGERRKASTVALRDFAAEAGGRSTSGEGKKLALVFGNEKHGLSDSELACCTLSVHIPSSPEFPSLNVAQAVQVACYEFFAAQKTHAAVPSELETAAPAPRALVDSEVTKIAGTLGDLGFFRKSDDSHVRQFLRDLCERAGASETEVRYLRELFLKCVAMAGKSSESL